MDSTACLHWARHHFEDVRAIGFDYGQPHRDAELTAAATIAQRSSVRFDTVVMTGIPRGGILTGVKEHDPLATGISPAYVPNRNGIFLNAALGYALLYWPIGDLDPS